MAPASVARPSSHKAQKPGSGTTVTGPGGNSAGAGRNGPSGPSGGGVDTVPPISSPSDGAGSMKGRPPPPELRGTLPVSIGLAETRGGAAIRDADRSVRGGVDAVDPGQR